MGFTLTTPPAVEPVSVLDAARQIRLDTSNVGTDEVIITVVAPGALTGETTVPVTPLTVELSAGDLLKFGTAQVVVLAEDAAIDDDEITVEELPFDLEAGTEATVESATDSDTELTGYIAAARRQAETHTGAGFIEQEWTVTLDGFPKDGTTIPLPRGPVVSVDSIAYLDTDGEEQEVDTELVVLDQTQLSANLSLVAGETWPATAAQRNAVTIVITVGYAEDAATFATTAPDIKAALLLRIADLYRNREAQASAPLTENRTVCALLDPHVRTALA